MRPEEQRRMKRLEDAVREAYVGVDDLLAGTPITSGPNGRVRWARTKRVRDNLKAALDDTREGPSGTVPMVLLSR